MDEENNTIACVEVYGAEGMFGEQYSQRVSSNDTPCEDVTSSQGNEANMLV